MPKQLTRRGWKATLKLVQEVKTVPKQKRWAIKQTMAQAHGCALKSQIYLVEVGKHFEAMHPDYYEAFCDIVQALEFISISINELSDLI